MIRYIALCLMAVAACETQPQSETVTPQNQAPPQAEAQPQDTPASATPPNPDALTANGWRDLRIGMSRAQVVAAAGEDANPNAVGGADPAQCDQFRPKSAPNGLLVMIERDTLTRISVSQPAKLKTDRGFGIGDSASVIQTAYGSAAVSGLHKYEEAPAAYITVWTKKPPAPDARGIVYEVGRDARVKHIHVGGPSIQYVEGCL